MTYDEHLWQCLQEEAAEVIQAASKINRFGLGDCYPGTEVTNKEKLIAESHDFLAVLHMINDRFGLGIGVGAKASEAMKKKQDKVLFYLDYAKERGVVVDET